jgi:hypothetical protein
MNEDQLRQLLAEEADRIAPAPAARAQEQVGRRAAQLRRRRNRMISGAGTIGLAAAVLVAVMISISSKPASHVVVPTGPAGPATTEPAGVLGVPDTSLPPEPPTGGSGPTSTAKPSPGRCHTNELSVTTGPVGAAAGTIDAAFVLTNTTKATCSLFGYSGFSLLDAQGHAIIGDVIRGGTAYAIKPQHISLAPGRAASFSVRYSDVPTGNGTCQTSATALITPPDETTQLTIRDQAPVCGSPFTVSPVVAGSNGAAP